MKVCIFLLVLTGAGALFLLAKWNKSSFEILFNSYSYFVNPIGNLTEKKYFTISYYKRSLKNEHKEMFYTAANPLVTNTPSKTCLSYIPIAIDYARELDTLQFLSQKQFILSGLMPLVEYRLPVYLYPYSSSLTLSHKISYGKFYTQKYIQELNQDPNDSRDLPFSKLLTLMAFDANDTSLYTYNYTKNNLIFLGRSLDRYQEEIRRSIPFIKSLLSSKNTVIIVLLNNSTNHKVSYGSNERILDQLVNIGATIIPWDSDNPTLARAIREEMKCAAY